MDYLLLYCLKLKRLKYLITSSTNLQDKHTMEMV